MRVSRPGKCVLCASAHGRTSSPFPLKPPVDGRQPSRPLALDSIAWSQASFFSLLLLASFLNIKPGPHTSTQEFHYGRLYTLLAHWRSQRSAALLWQGEKPPQCHDALPWPWADASRADAHPNAGSADVATRTFTGWKTAVILDELNLSYKTEFPELPMTGPKPDSLLKVRTRGRNS